MLRIGLTGGIGAGKSTAARAFGELGALVVDADAVAREVVLPGTPGLASVRERFGTAVLCPDGALDRSALGRLVFADAAARADLESITHPLIATRTAELIDAAPAGTVVVHDVPLLVEKHLGPAYHLVVVIGAPEDLRVQRVMRARGVSESAARSRVAAQADESQRRAAADVWLDNAGEPTDLPAAVATLWRDRIQGFEHNLQTGTRSRRPDELTLTAYDPTWPAQAQRLIERIERALGDRVRSVNHIGSTSVPGMLAKNVIDLQVTVGALADADDPAFVAALSRKGFPRVPDNLGDTVHPWEPDPAGWAKRFHASADPGRVAHLHVRRSGSAGWRAALVFRDWLRADEDARRAYQGAKREIAAHTTRTADYAAAKEPWFAGALPASREWAARSGWVSPSQG